MTEWEWWLHREDGALTGPFADEEAANTAATGEWSKARAVPSPPARRPKRPAHKPGCFDWRGGPCDCGSAA